MKQVFDVNLPVTGDLFIGREKEVEYLLRQIFQPALNRETQYLALTGMNRIGKTSLMREACRQFDMVEHSNVIVLETIVSDYYRFWEFWVYGVVKPLYRKLKFEVGISPDDLEAMDDIFTFFFDKSTYAKLVSGDEGTIADGKGYLFDLFDTLQDLHELHVVLIMDEFDLARQVFGERTDYFGWFRGLLQKVSGLSVLTLSRRSIDYIQLNSEGGSTLSGIFSKFGLFGFRNSEIDEYFQRLELHGKNLSTHERQRIYYYCGRSPYYLAIMGKNLLDNTDAVDFSSIACQFYSSFDAVINLLREEKLLRAMLEMFVGPRYDLVLADAGRLVDMGYCRTRSSLEIGNGGRDYEDYLQPKKTGEYLAVCHHFVQYLADVNKNEVAELWPKLTSTEHQLRKIMESEYRRLAQQNPGNTWQDLVWNDLVQPDPTTGMSITTEHKLHSFTYSFQSLYSKADPQQKRAVGNSALNLISLLELGKLIQLRWDRCFRYFSNSGYNRSDILDIFNTLKDARNPYAHSNAQLLTPADIENVNTICDNLMKSAQAELERQSARI